MFIYPFLITMYGTNFPIHCAPNRLFTIPNDSKPDWITRASSLKGNIRISAKKPTVSASSPPSTLQSSCMTARAHSLLRRLRRYVDLTLCLLFTFSRSLSTFLWGSSLVLLAWLVIIDHFIYVFLDIARPLARTVMILRQGRDVHTLVGVE